MTKLDDRRIAALEKIAFPGQFGQMCPTVGISNPPPSVGDVLSAIGVAQANDIGTPNQRRDAFGRIVNSGLENSSPADNALRLLGGGILGRAVASMVSGNPIIKGVGAGLGMLSAMPKY